MRVRRILAVAVVAGGCLAPAGTAGASPGAQQGSARPARQAVLPLGAPGLQESRSTAQIAPGATLTTVTRGRPSDADFWTVTAGFSATRPEAEALASRLRAAGFPARVEQVDGRAADDPEQGPVGFVVRTGRSSSQADMTALQARLAAAGFSGTSVTHTALDGRPTSGPWVVHILDVDLHRFRGSVQAHLGTDIVPDRETTSSIARRTAALAGVNGGYFVIPPADGTPGDLAGISVVDGRLVSEAVNGRAALALRGHPGPAGQAGRADVRRLSTALSLTSTDGATRVLNGRNRKPGLIRSCGEPGAQPTQRPKHDFTCTNPDDLVQFDSDFGTSADSGPGEQAVLDRRGRVLSLQPTRGGSIPPGGSVVEGIGTGAKWLAGHAAVGRVLRVRTEVDDERGRRVGTGPTTDIVNGGPLLVRNGRPFVDANAEGFVQPDRPDFYYGFAVRRNPRTMAGVTGRDHLLLVTVDGRQPGYSVGLSFPEESAVMASLGARDALNLDGGGSTTTVGRGATVLGRPSDTTGERPVGDAVLLYPPQRGMDEGQRGPDGQQGRDGHRHGAQA